MTDLHLLFITKNFSHHVERSSYYLAQALSRKIHLTVRSEDGDIRDILKGLPTKPDFVLLNDFKPDYSPFVRRLRYCPVPYGIIMHDLKYKIPQRKRFIQQEDIHHIFSIYRDPFLRWYPEFADRMMWLPHHVPMSVFKDFGLPKTTDWLMMGALFEHIYPLRAKMHHTFNNKPGFQYHAHPGYRDIGDRESNIFVGERYARLLNQAKIFMTCDSRDHFALLKYYEAAACNTLLLGAANQELTDLGFIDGDTFVAINENDFYKKARFYLGQEEERQRIAKAGMEMVRRRHSTDQRADELVQHIREIIGK